MTESVIKKQWIQTVISEYVNAKKLHFWVCPAPVYLHETISYVVLYINWLKHADTMFVLFQCLNTYIVKAFSPLANFASCNIFVCIQGEKLKVDCTKTCF